MSPGQITIVRPAEGKDAADHLAAGLPVTKFKSVDKNKIARIAQRSRPRRTGKWATYRGAS